MRLSVLLITLVLLCAGLPASIPHPRAVYVSGSAAVPNGTEGSLNLGDETEFLFNYADDTFRLPYARIISMELGDKPGAKAHMATAASWIPKFGKKQGRLLTIAYMGERGAGEVAIFEIMKSEFVTIEPVLEARTGKRVRPADPDGGSNPAMASHEIASSLVPVTITSTPPGAFVFFWGQTVGKTPVTTRLAPGPYTVRLAAEGYPAWTHDIMVEPGKPLTVSAELNPAEEEAVASAH